MEKQQEPQQAEQAATYSAARLGYEFSASVLICTGLGWLADREWGTKPFGLLIMLVIGFVVGMMNVWRGLSGVDQTVGWRRIKKIKDDKRETD